MLKHIHKFKKAKYKTGTEYFFCAGVDCYFKLDKSLALGKLTICWRCNKPFELNKYAITLVKPHCEECHQLSSSRNKKSKTPSVEDLMPKLDDLLDKEINNELNQQQESKFSFAGRAKSTNLSTLGTNDSTSITRSLKERLNSSASAGSIESRESSDEIDDSDAEAEL